MESIRNYDVSIRIVTDGYTICDVYRISAGSVSAAKHRALIRALAENKGVTEIDISGAEAVENYD